MNEQQPHITQRQLLRCPLTSATRPYHQGVAGISGALLFHCIIFALEYANDANEFG